MNVTSAPPETKMQEFGGEDTLEGEGPLEGFELSVSKLFVE